MIQDSEFETFKELHEILERLGRSKTIDAQSITDMRDAIAAEATMMAGILERVQKMERILERQFPGAKYIK